MMPRLLRPLAGLAALLLAAPAFAQSGNPAVVTPGTPELAPGPPAPSTVNAADRLFLQQAAIGGMTEVELAELVLSRSHNTEVEAFADRMKADHGQANAELKSIADAAGMKLPTTLDADHRAVRERLATISNQAFDLAYLQGQLVDRFGTGSHAQGFRQQKSADRFGTPAPGSGTPDQAGGQGRIAAARC
jgi:putative membrane protein